MKNHIRILALIAFLPFLTQANPDCSVENEKLVTQASASRIQQIFHSYKNGAFGQFSTVKDGLVSPGIDQLQSLSDCSHKWLNQQNPTAYALDIQNLEKFKIFLVTVIPLLNTKYKNYLELKKQKIILNPKSKISNADKQELVRYSSKITTYIKEAEAIADKALAKMIQGTLPKNIPSQLEKIFPKYDKFFKDFNQIANQAIDQDQLKQFIVAHNIHFDTPYEVEDFVNRLEKFVYRAKSKKIGKTALKVFEITRSLYPGVLSAFETEAVSNTKDKASMILYSEALLYSLALQLLQRDINLLLEAKSK